MGSASDSNPGAGVVGVLLALHSRIVIFSNMNFLDEVLWTRFQSFYLLFILKKRILKYVF